MAVAVREPSEGRAQVIAFLLDAYDGVPTKPGKGLPHAQAVADVLRDAGYDLRVQLAGLLHDIVEDTDRSVDDVREHFGETVAQTVAALTEDDGIRAYARRKRALREQLHAAGSPAMDIALADKIATLRHALLTETRVRQRKLRHYRATLELGRDAGIAEALCQRVEELLDEAETRSWAARATRATEMARHSLDPASWDSSLIGGEVCVQRVDDRLVLDARHRCRPSTRGPRGGCSVCF
jgi:(p)ppGpp synthase/HD superfamily hydrolase